MNNIKNKSNWTNDKIILAFISWYEIEFLLWTLDEEEDNEDVDEEEEEEEDEPIDSWSLSIFFE